MIPTLTHPRAVAGERFQVMLAMFAFDRPDDHQRSSILCRVLDGRELEDVCPIDEAILSPAERKRYGSLRNPRQRALACRTRAELRRMLGREIGLPPQSVPIECDGRGKPRCLHPRAEGLDFSIAHAEECALIAIGEAESIGVDAERILEEEPSDELLDILFSDEEAEQWHDVPAETRRRAFTEAWTIKEAALKASGAGLESSPHDLSVRFHADGSVEPVFPGPNWICERLNFCPCYAACCVVILPGWGEPRHLLAA